MNMGRSREGLGGLRPRAGVGGNRVPPSPRPQEGLRGRSPRAGVGGNRVSPPSCSMDCTKTDWSNNSLQFSGLYDVVLCLQWGKTPHISLNLTSRKEVCYLNTSFTPTLPLAGCGKAKPPRSACSAYEPGPFTGGFGRATPSSRGRGEPCSPIISPPAGGLGGRSPCAGVGGNRVPPSPRPQEGLRGRSPCAG